MDINQLRFELSLHKVFNWKITHLVEQIKMCNDYAICKTMQGLENAYGTPCCVVGMYDIRPFTTKKNIVFVHWPVIVLEENTIVLLQSFWNHENGRSPAEKKDFVGKMVQAKGVLYREPPAENASQNIAIPCISPVEQIELVQRQD